VPSAPADQNVAALRAGDRLAELDGLRGIAILFVIVLHYVARAPVPANARPLFGQPNWLLALADMSWSGVDLFFVLSGFLIGGILLDHRQSPNLWRAFYSRRVGRIFPAYFLLLLLAVIGLPGDPPRPEGAVPLVTYFLFIQNLWRGALPVVWLGPCWSIAIEEQFYLTASPAACCRSSSDSVSSGRSPCGQRCSSRLTFSRSAGRRGTSRSAASMVRRGASSARGSSGSSPGGRPSMVGWAS
jgi:peptidoglycan/LPS O-acetylase OafA/YrhL